MLLTVQQNFCLLMNLYHLMVFIIIAHDSTKEVLFLKFLWVLIFSLMRRVPHFMRLSLTV